MASELSPVHCSPIALVATEAGVSRLPFPPPIAAPCLFSRGWSSVAVQGADGESRAV